MSESVRLPEPVLDWQQEQLREWAEANLDLPRLYEAIDADHALVGAGVVYIDKHMNVVELRSFEPICRLTPVTVVIREAPESVSPQEFASDLEHDKVDAHLVAEALGSTLACTGAFLSWMVVTSGVMTAPFSGGASLVVSAIGKAAAVASTLQCINAGARTRLAAINPKALENLDSNEWYTSMATALDTISLAGAVASGYATIKTVLLAKRASSRSMRQILRGMGRAERKRLTTEVIRAQNPGISNGTLKAMQRASRVPKRLTAEQVQQATVTQIRDALSGVLAFTGSAMSGTVRSIAIGLYEEAE